MIVIKTTENDDLIGNGYFRVAQSGGEWSFVRPDGGRFFSIGLNHIEETNLKYPHNINIWREKYGSRENWIAKGVLPDLADWHFNTLGWTQEYVTGDFGEDQDWFGEPFNLGHSTGWAASELIASGLPYVANLPLAEIQDWRGDPTFPDVFSNEFDQWCAYLARSVCLEHAGSQNLLGYFLVDIPAWIPHASGKFFSQMEGLTGDRYDNRLAEVASAYYSTIAKHIRAVDPSHLILGDRYNGNKGIPAPVLEALKRHVDVLSIQYFCGESEADQIAMHDFFEKAHKATGKPILNADIGSWTATKLNPKRATGLASQAARGALYANALGMLSSEPWFVGWHWCAYVENTARGWGAKDPWDTPYDDFVGPVRSLNKRVLEARS